MDTAASLLKIADGNRLGPPLTFTSAHVALALISIGESRLIGRQALAEQTGLGAGAVRTLLGKLRANGLASANASGCYLTESGVKSFRSLTARVSSPIELKKTALTLGSRQSALVARGRGPKVGGGIEQRDAAIKVGASGATTLVIKGRKFTVPGGSPDCESDFPGPVWKVLRDKLAPSDGDAIVLCGASSETLARLGAMAAALTLL